MFRQLIRCSGYLSITTTSSFLKLNYFIQYFDLVELNFDFWHVWPLPISPFFGIYTFCLCSFMRISIALFVRMICHTKMILYKRTVFAYPNRQSKTEDIDIYLKIFWIMKIVFLFTRMKLKNDKTFMYPQLCEKSVSSQVFYLKFIFFTWSK